ncbi:MAG TPA: flagellin [Pyrinomonadaceae bacterium]|nr:flagellin [Pyrinomonadaceae bacterium]
MSNFSLVNNLGSSSAQTKLSMTNTKLNSTLQRLSSGLRINKSGDDAAGLAIANSFRSDISVLSQGVRNANDGLSTLQIIDGGLNTISGLLDRAASLASQSASGTFTGDRNTLQAELGKVFGEIDRQAQNVGLGGAAGSDEGRFNRSINVFIGGGANASAGGNSVAVDLSNSRVDRTGLSLNNINIGQGTGSVTGAQDISGGITADETLSFQTVGSSGQIQSFSVSLSAGATASNVLDTINNDSNIQDAGIKASLDTNGKLVLSSAAFFAVSSDTADGAGQTGIAGAGSVADDVAVTGAANKVTKTLTAGTAGATQTLSFTGEQIGYANTSKDVSFSSFAAVSASNADSVAASVNNDTSLRESGVFAVRTKADGSEVSFVSLKDFNVAISSSAGAVNATNNIDALQTPTAATGATLTGGEQGGKDALSAIKSALSTLGQIQGKVGAGQNNLEQAIDLATTQITNYQSAESAIRDADVAAEASNMSRLNTLQQAGVAALAQANQSSQALLSLLR